MYGGHGADAGAQSCGTGSRARIAGSALLASGESEEPGVHRFPGESSVRADRPPRAGKGSGVILSGYARIAGGPRTAGVASEPGAGVPAAAGTACLSLVVIAVMRLWCRPLAGPGSVPDRVHHASPAESCPVGAPWRVPEHVTRSLHGLKWAFDLRKYLWA
jgi:hypothetical protein